MLHVILTQGQAMTTRECWLSGPMSWMRWVGGSGPPLQTLVVLWRGGKLWQARTSYGKLSKWNPTNWHRLESQHSHSYELLLTQTVFRLGGVELLV